MNNFLLLCCYSVVFSLSVVFCVSPIFAIINLILYVISMSFLLFFLQLEFLAFMLLQLYVGAIIVLFLFVMLMLQIDMKFHINIEFQVWEIIFYFFSIKLYLFLLYFNVGINEIVFFHMFEFVDQKSFFIFSSNRINCENDVLLFISMFMSNTYYLILVGMTLLFAMIGSIALVN